MDDIRKCFKPFKIKRGNSVTGYYYAFGYPLNHMEQNKNNDCEYFKKKLFAKIFCRKNKRIVCRNCKYFKEPYVPGTG